MKKRIVALLLTVSIVIGNGEFVYAVKNGNIETSQENSKLDTESNLQNSKEEQEKDVTESKVTDESVTDKPEEIKNTAITDDEYNYKILNGSYCSITGYKGNSKEIDIPEEIEGYIVQKIDDNAFAGNTEIVSVTFSDQIECIGEKSFYGCSSLEKIKMGEKLETISSEAFSQCVRLNSIEFSENIKAIQNNAFENCSNLEKLEFPSGIKSLSGRAFYNCRNLKSIEYPAGWEETPDSYNNRTDYGDGNNYYTSPFEGCESLTEIEIPKGVTTVPKHAFQNCTGLKKVVLPEGMTEIGAYAFKNAGTMQEINFPETLSKIGSYTFSECKGLTEAEIPDSVTEVGRNAYAGCTGIKNLQLGKGIETIASSVFSDCSGLTKLNLSENLTAIQSYAFQNCSSLEKIEFPSSVRSLSGRAFYNCKKLKNIGYPVNWEETPDSYYNRTDYGDGNDYYTSPFEGCESLTEIEIPKGVTTVPKHAFQNCTGLKKVVLPEGMTEIGAYAFKNAGTMQEINFPETLSKIGSYTFSECKGLTEAEIPDSVTEVGRNAYAGCTGIKNLQLGKGIETIASSVFSDCSGLTKLNLSENLTAIQSYAFQNCSSLEKIEFPSSVRSLSGRAFYNCKKLKNIGYPVNWKETPDRDYNRTDYGDGRNEYTSPFEGCESLTEIEIPKEVTVIPKHAFQNCGKLKLVSGAENLEKAENYAFANAESLGKIWIGEKVTEIGDQTFTNDEKLTIHGVEGSYAQQYADEKEIPFSTEKLIFAYTDLTGKVVNQDEKGETDVEVNVYDVTQQEFVGKTITDVEGKWSLKLQTGHKYSLYYYKTGYDIEKNLIYITLKEKDEKAETVMVKKNTHMMCPDEKDFQFSAINGSYCKITGYTGSASDIILPEKLGGYAVQSIGKGAFKNKDNLQSIAMPGTLESIEEEAFSGCSELKEVKMNSGLNTLGKRAFYQCNNLAKVEFPNTLHTIGGYAFADCTGLQEINLPESLERIESYAFQECTGLEKVVFPSSVRSLSGRSFYNCKKLKNIGYPVNWEETPDSYYNRTDYGDGNDYYTSPFEGCESLTEIEIPKGVTTVPKHAFQNCTGLKTVVLPEGMEEIGAYAFKSVGNMQEINLPKTLSKIGSYVFTECKGLTEVVIPDSVTEVGRNAYAGCTGIKNLQLGKGIETIASSVFSDCSGLTKLNLSENLTAIQSYAFQNCSSLEKIEFPSSVRSLSGRAFYNCKKLKNIGYPVNWEETPDSYYNRTDYGDGNDYYTSPFEGCESLTEIEIPKGVTTVPKHAFQNCKKLKKVILPEEMTEIGAYAFAGNSALRDIKLPVNLAQINKYTFNNCISLNELVIPDNVNKIEDSAYRGCSGLRLIQTNNKLESIEQYAFAGCEGVISLTLNEGLLEIGTSTFEGCSNLSAVTIPKSVKTLSDNSFSNCHKLKIYCYSGSIAHTVAEKNSYEYYLLDAHAHEYKTTIETSPTCVRGGSEILTCTVCGYNYVRILDALGHQEGEWKVKEEPTCVKEGKKVKECKVCKEVLEEISISPKGHQYGGWNIRSESTCTKEGEEYRICSVCGYEDIKKAAALGHEYETVARIDKNPTCTEDGSKSYHCKRCGSKINSTVLPAKGHVWGKWTTETEATVLQEGIKSRTCSECGEQEKEVIKKPEIDYKNNIDYGMVQICVVDATNKQKISGASIFVTTEDAGESTLITDSEGKVMQILPVGNTKLSVYANGYQVRNVSITVLPGMNEVPVIGISKNNLVTGKLTTKEMTKEEMINAGIDVSAPENRHKYKYDLVLEFIPKIDFESIGYYLDSSGVPEILGPNTNDGPVSPGKSDMIKGKGGGTFTYLRDHEGRARGFKYTNGKKVTTVYPISERFFLIIHGEVRWLKEMYDVELMAINSSLTDQVENLTAEVNLPEGLSLATMTGEQQQLIQNMGTLESGESKSVHWYVRGDKEGSYNISATLKGVMQPFGDEFEYSYETLQPLKVYAGSAMHLTYYVPDSAYYNEDYTVKIDLENVSNKTLYDVTHEITGVEQIRVTTYSDGHEEIENYPVTGGTGSIHVAEFKPGDVIHIEVTTTIMFQSKLMEYNMKKMVKTVRGMEGLLNGFKAFKSGVELMSSLSSWAEGSNKSIDKFISSSTITEKDKVEMAKKLAKELKKLAAKGKADPKSQLTKAIGQLKTSGVWNEIEEIQNNPDILESYTNKDLERLANKIEAANKEADLKNFDPYDAIETAIELIPVKFVLKNSWVSTVEEDSTTVIPSSIVIEPTDNHYFGIDSVSSYVWNLCKACIGKDLDTPALAKFLGMDFKKDIGYYDAVEYVKVVEERAKQYNVVGTSGAGFTAWVERADTNSLSKEKEQPEYMLTVNNDTATYDDNGKLHFEGSGILSVTPKNGVDGVLCIEMEDGTIAKYPMEVVEQHECTSEKWISVYPPTDTESGLDVKYCDICDEMIDMKTVEKCSNHEFSEYVEEQSAGMNSAGIKKKTCIHCGYAEYEYTDAYSLNNCIYEFEEGTTVKDVKDFFAERDINIIVPDMDENELVKTGMKIEVDNQIYKLVIKGDVDGDAEVTIFDAMDIMDHIDKKKSMDGANFEAGLSNKYQTELKEEDLLNTINLIKGIEEKGGTE